jgi:hypothetical protein
MNYRVGLQSSSLWPSRNRRTHLRLSTAPLWGQKVRLCSYKYEGPDVGRLGAETGRPRT